MKHSLWIRTSGGTSGSADTAAGQAEGEMLPAVGEPVEGVDPRGRAESVSEPQRQHDPGYGSSPRAGASCSPSVLVETVRERVAQEYDVAEPAHLRQLRTAVWVPREASIADKPLRPGVAHEERRQHQVQLVR